jgi:hypothetical protein
LSQHSTENTMVKTPTHSGNRNVLMRAAERRAGHALLLCLLLGGAACERNAALQSPNAPGTPDSPTPPAAPVNLTGNWTGSLTDNGTVKNDATLRLTHTNNNVTGTISWTGPTTAMGTVSGTVSGGTFSFRIVIPVGGFTSPPSTRFCLASLTGLAVDVSAEQINADYTGTNTCSGLVPFPGALRVARN